MEKIYFQNEDAENCYPESHFQEIMKEDGLTSIEVIEAIPVPESEEEYVYCKDTGECYEKADCGTHCTAYEAISIDNEKCVHKGQYCDFGETITLKLN